MRNSPKIALSFLAILLLPLLSGEDLKTYIAGDEPVAWWGFEEGDQSAALEFVGGASIVEGPDPSTYPLFENGNRALKLDGNGSYALLRDAETRKALRFEQGEAITIEAWVSVESIQDGQICYVVGKGRDYLDGESIENQNWALRLYGVDGQVRISFLYRSEESEGAPGDYHRWKSHYGFLPGKGWHHVSVSYEFGKPSSISGRIDGQYTKGSWDLGGSSERAPVSDEGEVMIGASRGGLPPNSLNGAVDEIAVYRKALDGDALKRRYAHRSTAPEVPFSAFKKDRVLVEIFEQSGTPGVWPHELGEPDARFTIENFALFDLPQKYGSKGERLSYRGPYLLRLSGLVDLPGGGTELLARTSDLSRIWLEGEKIADIEALSRKTDAHGHMRPAADPNLPYPRGRLGTMDTRIEIEGESGPRLLTLEAFVGKNDNPHPVYELLLSYRNPQSKEWNLLGPAQTETLAFDERALHQLRQSQKDEFDELSREQRREALDKIASRWEKRHQIAREYIQSLDPIESPHEGVDFDGPHAIDQLLAARIAEHNSQIKSEPGDEHFRSTVWPIIEDNCIRCHGTKAKGGLKLDSLAAALAGGESDYPTIVPGKPDESELVFRISAEDEADRMPPKGAGLSEAEVAILSDWIREGAKWSSSSTRVETPDRLGDLEFLRRIYLDTVGVPPTPEEVERYVEDSRPDRKARLVDRLLDDPRHADHWVPYWQDVLAENPSIMKPTLNNTGPFRYWIHDSLRDNKPFDQFVTELVSFQGDVNAGGAAGFKLATDNDAPMAAKAHVIGTAFLGTEMKCARCHDSPYHSTTQEDLFSIAAMLEGKPLKVPATSTVPATFFKKLEGRKPLITISLDPDTPINPGWPFDELVAGEFAPAMEGGFKSSAEELAWQLTRPENARFSKVLVNRVWKRYFGQGFVEPAHDWEGNEPSHPALLEHLAREFVADGYDVKRLSRTILLSDAYSREPIYERGHAASDRFFQAPLRRRMSAEQLVDSLFHTTGVPLFSEELTLDVEGNWKQETFENYGFPKRAWEFVSTSTERERASLALPLVNEITTLMRVYGWRPSRAEPITERNADANVLQSGFLANSSLGLWLTNLSDYSELTAMAHDARSAEALVGDLFLRFLTRRPTPSEREDFVSLLGPGFETRRAKSVFRTVEWIPETREVTWSNHLSVEANFYAADMEERLLKGPPPTASLDPDWRERMEDAVWTLVNSPEFQYIQ